MGLTPAGPSAQGSADPEGQHPCLWPALSAGWKLSGVAGDCLSSRNSASVPNPREVYGLSIIVLIGIVMANSVM